MFQIVRCILADNGEVTLREPLQPLFELWEDATAMAEFEFIPSLRRLRL